MKSTLAFYSPIVSSTALLLHSTDSSLIVRRFTCNSTASSLFRVLFIRASKLSNFCSLVRIWWIFTPISSTTFEASKTSSPSEEPLLSLDAYQPAWSFGFRFHWKVFLFFSLFPSKFIKRKDLIPKLCSVARSSAGPVLLLWHRAQTPPNINRGNGIEIPEAWMPMIKQHSSWSVPRWTAEGTFLVWMTRIEILQSITAKRGSKCTNQHKPRYYLYCYTISQHHCLMKTSSIAVKMSRSTSMWLNRETND